MDELNNQDRQNSPESGRVNRPYPLCFEVEAKSAERWKTGVGNFFQERGPRSEHEGAFHFRESSFWVIHRLSNSLNQDRKKKNKGINKIQTAIAEKLRYRKCRLSESCYFQFADEITVAKMIYPPAERRGLLSLEASPWEGPFKTQQVCDADCHSDFPLCHGGGKNNEMFQLQNLEKLAFLSQRDSRRVIPRYLSHFLRVFGASNFVSVHNGFKSVIS